MVSAHMVWTPQGLGTRRPFWLSGRATHVPLLNFLKMSVQLAPSRARRLATTLRTHSSTQPSGRTYFHRAGFLLPMVVSSVTWRMAGGRCKGAWRGLSGRDPAWQPRPTTQGSFTGYSTVIYKTWIGSWLQAQVPLPPWDPKGNTEEPCAQLCPDSSL